MKYSTDPIFEAYSNHRKQFILEQSVQDFYNSDPLQGLRDSFQYDLKCIEELVTEGMLGDAFGKVKGGIKKATSFVANKGLQLLFSLIKKTATPEELKEIEKLQDPQFLEQKAKEGKELLKGSEGSVTNNESVYLNKAFFGSTILTEANIEKMLVKYVFINEQILSEAKRGFVGGGKKSKSPKAASWVPSSDVTRARKRGGKAAQEKAKANKPMQLSKFVKQVANQLKQNYSPAQIAKFGEMLNKKIGNEQKDLPSSQESGLAVSKFDPKAKRPLGSRKEPEQREGEFRMDTSSSEEEAPTAKKEGIIRKAINWVKANPKRTAGTLVGIIAAIGIAVGGPAVLLPMLAKAGLGSTATGAITGAVGGAGLGAAKNIASQGFSNKKFSGKALGKAALKGGAIGAAFGAIGGASKLADQDVTGTADSGTGEVDTTDTGDTAEGGDSDYTGGTGDVSATPEDFQKFNQEPLDPKSWRDKIKMAALDKLKRDGGGEIDAAKYNNFVKKLLAMGKGAQGKSIESIMGESYTVHYLSLLR